MPQLIKTAERRRNLALSLDQVATEVSAALSRAKLDIPIFFTVPSSGALMTFATPTDPNDAEWASVCEIVVPIVSRSVGGHDLICQTTPCASTGARMAAGDLLTAADSASADG